MKNSVVPIWTESTRNLIKPVVVLVITFAATVKLSQALYRYSRSRARNRSETMSSASSSGNEADVRRSRVRSSKLYFDIPNSKVNLYVDLICVLNFVLWIGV